VLDVSPAFCCLDGRSHHAMRARRHFFPIPSPRRSAIVRPARPTFASRKGVPLRTTLWSRTAAFAAAAVLSLVAALGLSTSATAAPAAAHTSSHAAVTTQAAAATCPSTYTCFWVNDYYGGTMGKVAGNNSNYMNLSNSSGCTKYPGTWNDCISSITNQGTQCTVYFWTDAGYSDRYHSVAIGDWIGNFYDWWGDSAFNDAISSNHWCNPT